MCCDIHDVESILIKLQNGSMTMETKRGLIALSPKMRLSHVLYVTGLNCNLISTAQLIEQSFCDVTFMKKFCVIQDLTMRSLIGVDEPRRGYTNQTQISPPLSENKQVIVLI